MQVSFNCFNYIFVFGILRKAERRSIGPWFVKARNPEFGDSGRVRRGFAATRSEEHRSCEAKSWSSKFFRDGSTKHGNLFQKRQSEEKPPGVEKMFIARTEDFLQLALNAKIILKPGILEVAIKKPGKQELLLALRRLLKPYSAFNLPLGAPFKVAINNIIETDSARYCSIHLSHEDLQLIWHELD